MTFFEALETLVRTGEIRWGFLSAAAIVLALTPLAIRLAPLVGAVDEAARLLDADGAMVYLLDPDTEVLRFAFDAGIRSAQSRALVRRIELPIGTGMFGRAVDAMVAEAEALAVSRPE